MTVEELVEILSEYPKDMEVLVDGNTISEVETLSDAYNDDDECVNIL